MKTAFSCITTITSIALLAACVADGDDPSGGGDASAWVGNWSAAGTQSTTCGAQSATTQISDLVVISTGPDDAIQTSANSCALIWDLDGRTATLRPGQLCTVAVNGFNVTVMWTQSTATLGDGIIAATSTGATNNGCSFMQQMMMTRMR